MDFYHVLNRGVDKRSIFMDQRDHARFVHDLYVFNHNGRVNNVHYSFKNNDIVSHYLKETLKKTDGTPQVQKKKIVNIHGWCLMKNHYHLLLSERVEGGITKFIRKLNIGYAKYFNERHKRTGTLFQGRTKKILIETDRHFMYILHYIHLNPLDFVRDAENWRDGQISSARRAKEFLKKYRWSSYPDYIGERNFPSVITTKFFDNAYGGYKKSFDKYLGNLDTASIQELTLE